MDEERIIAIERRLTAQEAIDDRHAKQLGGLRVGQLQLKRELGRLDAKLDRILEAVETLTNRQCEQHQELAILKRRSNGRDAAEETR